MNNNEIDFRLLLKAVWGKRKTVLLWALASMVLGTIIVFSIPNQYKSTVLLAPEGDNSANKGSASMMASLVGINMAKSNEGVNQKIYPQILSSTPFLLEFASVEVTPQGGQTTTLMEYVNKGQKQPWWSYVFGLPGTVVNWWGSSPQAPCSTADRQKLTDDQKQFIRSFADMVAIDVADDIITASATLQDPKIAALVADTLVATMQNYVTEYRTSKARRDLEHTETLYEQAHQKYIAAQAKYAQMRDQNQNLISETARTKIEQAQTEYQVAVSVFQQMANQLVTTQFKLQEEMPIATVIQPAYVSDFAERPKKKVIIFALGFLGLLVSAGVVAIKAFSKKPQEE